METRGGARLRVVPDVFNNVQMDFLLRSRTKPIRCTPNAISPQNGHESMVHWSAPDDHVAPWIIVRTFYRRAFLSKKKKKEKKECLSGSVCRWYVTRKPKKSGWIRLEDVKSGSVAVQNDSSHPPSHPLFLLHSKLCASLANIKIPPPVGEVRDGRCDERCKSVWRPRSTMFAENERGLIGVGGGERGLRSMPRVNL